MKKLVIVAAVLALAACGSKKDKEPTQEGSGSAGSATAKPPEPPKPAGRAIPNSNGLVVDAPAKWLDNGVGGAAGMHLDADQGNFQLRELSGEEAKQSMDKKVDEIAESMAGPWVLQQKRPNGWHLISVQDKVEMQGDKMVKTGTAFAFDVRRVIGKAVYTCYGPAATKAIAEEAIALCDKVEKP